MTVFVLWRVVGLHSTQSWWLIVTARSVFGWIQTELASSLAKNATSECLWNLTTRDHKEGGQLEDGRSVGASSCNSIDAMGQRVHSLMFMMMMIVVITYPPFSTMTNSRYPVPSMVIKLWITIMQLPKTFPSFGIKLKETWLYLMSAGLHCLRFYY